MGGCCARRRPVRLRAREPGSHSPGVLLALAAGPVGLHVARGRARRRYAAAVPAALEQLAAALRGGASPAEAVASVGETNGPVAADLRRVTARADLGLGLADALAAWPVDRPTSSVRAAAGALAVAAGVGGRAAPALDGLAASLRERLGAVAEARSLSAQARLSAVVVGAGPLAYLGLTALVDPSSVAALVETSAGACASPWVSRSTCSPSRGCGGSSVPTRPRRDAASPSDWPGASCSRSRWSCSRGEPPGPLGCRSCVPRHAPPGTRWPRVAPRGGCRSRPTPGAGARCTSCPTPPRAHAGSASCR